MSETTTIQLYGTTEADNIANVDMPDEGHILSAHIYGRVSTMAADADGFLYELSFGSTSSFTSNDARGVIAIAGFNNELVGVAANTMRADAIGDFYFGVPGIKVFAGERIYLHGITRGGSGANDSVRALLVCSFAKFTARRR